MCLQNVHIISILYGYYSAHGQNGFIVTREHAANILYQKYGFAECAYGQYG